MAKKKIFLYKEGCYPRIFVNPDEDTLISLKKAGIILINPNEGSIHGIPLHHTYPDVKNNLIRPIPIKYRKSTKGLRNPLEKVKADQELKDIKKQHIHFHLISILYTTIGISATLLMINYSEEILELLKKTGF